MTTLSNRAQVSPARPPETIPGAADAAGRSCASSRRVSSGTPFRVAVAVAALLLLLAGGVTACAGVRGTTTAAAKGHPPGAGEVRLIVSRDFGASVMHDEVVPWHEGLDVMTLLAERVRVDTSYGGGFVDAIDGVKSTFGGASSAKAADWFYWVDGIMAGIGAADFELQGGDTVWWDYHQWADAMSIPATLSAFPTPWRGRSLEVTTDDRWPGLQQWAEASGLRLGGTSALGTGVPVGGLVVATPEQAGATPWLSRGLTSSGGVRLVSLGSDGLSLLSPSGSQGPRVGAVALALPAEDGGARPLLVVLAGSTADAERMFSLLTPDALAGHVAVALIDDKLTALPWQGE